MKKLCAAILIAFSSVSVAENIELANAMSEANSYYKMLRRADDATWAEKLEMAELMTQEYIKSVGHWPKTITVIEDKKLKKKLMAQYNGFLYASIANMYKLQLACIEEDQDAFDEYFYQLKAGKKEAHEAFIEE